jgi:DnaK suppressor protein
MTKKNLKEVRESLKQRLGQLELQLDTLSKEPITDDQVQDPGDQALSSTMETLRSSLQDTELAEYNRIVRALEKIDEGTYGVCIDCGGEIAEKRLSSYPNAERCIVCQEQFEDRSSF